MLLEIARPAREKPRLVPELTCTLIREICQDRYLTAAQIAELLTRDKDKVQERFLNPMVAKQELRLRFPSEPSHPSQAYTTNETKIDVPPPTR